MGRYHYLAFDLGAESGRAILGTLEEKKLKIQELSRFPNGPINILGHLHWNIFNLFDEIKKGMRICSSLRPLKLESLAVDTWGVDFGLLASDGSIVGLPYSYRDSRTRGAMEEFFKQIPRERIYKLTGIQFMPINSLFQLFSMVRDRSPLLDVASDLLFMPDIFNYLLTGEKKTEFTIATTSQLYNPRRRTWSEELFRALGISKKIMQEVISPATIIGRLLPAISEEAGLEEIPVVATASHDTAAAVASIPAQGENWAYLSSGTWSLMGVEARNPIITQQALEFNFTNEGGVEGFFRFLKNITGLWLVQQCRKKWAERSSLSYEELTQMAGASSPFKALIDPDCPDFLNPPDMPEAILQFCKKTGQASPDTPAAFVRSILESLALKYRFVLEQLRKVVSQSIEKIHIIGGGARNSLLCQFAADATSLPVLAGPVEATAMGNILGQALALGHIHSLAEMREIIKSSSELKTYEPKPSQDWDRAYESFQKIIHL